MTTLLRQLIASMVLLGAVACAHAPVAPPPAVAWPEPPAAPALRLTALWSRDTLRAPAKGTLRRLAGILVGEPSDDAAPELLVRPFGVAVDASGQLYVADPDARLVLRISPDGLAETISCGAAPWTAPMAVALGADGALFVADPGQGAVLRIDAGAGCRPLASGAFERPTGLLAAPGLLLVADAARDQVVAVPLDGAPPHPWGDAGPGPAFHGPLSLARAADGTVLLVDALNFRVVRLSAEGAWLGSFTAPDDGGGLRRPKGLAVDAAGRVYVSDAERDQVLRFGPDGAYQEALGARGEAAGWLGAPAGLAVAGQRLYVADSLNRRIQVFAILGERP
jgi:sugar lactone lactonase YvrE